MPKFSRSINSPISAWEAKELKKGRGQAKLSEEARDEIRRKVNAKLGGYMEVAPPAIECLAPSGLPPRGVDEPPDMLTPLVLQRICEYMSKNLSAVEAAAQSQGLPPELAREYHKRGCNDLRRGAFGTRMAYYAMMVNQAEAQVKAALLQGVRENPLGWLNSAWLLERQWPDGYSLQRVNAQAKNNESEALAAVAKLLEKGRGGEGAPLPVIDVEDVLEKRQVVVDAEEADDENLDD